MRFRWKVTMFTEYMDGSVLNWTPPHRTFTKRGAKRVGRQWLSKNRATKPDRWNGFRVERIKK